LIRTQTDIAQTATATSGTNDYLLASIASISLLGTGRNGIMNIMLRFSNRGRTREIGLRMAIGPVKRYPEAIPA